MLLDTGRMRVEPGSGAARGARSALRRATAKRQPTKPNREQRNGGGLRDRRRRLTLEAVREASLDRSDLVWFIGGQEREMLDRESDPPNVVPEQVGPEPRVETGEEVRLGYTIDEARALR